MLLPAILKSDSAKLGYLDQTENYHFK